MLHCLVLSVDQTKAKTLPAPPPLRSKGEKVVTSCVLLRFGGHSRVNGRKQFCLMLSTTTRALKARISVLEGCQRAFSSAGDSSAGRTTATRRATTLNDLELEDNSNNTPAGCCWSTTEMSVGQNRATWVDQRKGTEWTTKEVNLPWFGHPGFDPQPNDHSHF